MLPTTVVAVIVTVRNPAATTPAVVTPDAGARPLGRAVATMAVPLADRRIPAIPVTISTIAFPIHRVPARGHPDRSREIADNVLNVV